jgi:peptidyl-tRNA hydrolase
MGHHQPPMVYNEQQAEHPRHNTGLTTIEETQHDIQNQLHQHTPWQAEMGERITTIQQHQE